jgi:hypothetical protein
VRLEHFAVGKMEPREHDQAVTGLDAVERVGEPWVDLDQGVRRAVGLIGRL